MRKVLVLGATSAIAEHTARLFASAGDSLFLVARNPGKLDAVAADLRVRGAASVACRCLDLNDPLAHASLVHDAIETLGGLDVVVIAQGLLGDQAECERDVPAARLVIDTNFTAVVSLLTPIANYLEQRGSGSIVGISSVAGDRGRASNYVYGASKAALSVFLSGLRNRLARKGVQVITVKPGFVDTPMTAHVPKNALFAKPEAIAQGIYQAVEKKKDVVYLPFYWRYIMLIIRSVPERVFKKLKL